MKEPRVIPACPPGYRRFRYAKLIRGTHRARSWEEAISTMYDRFGTDIYSLRGDERYYVFAVPEGSASE